MGFSNVTPNVTKFLIAIIAPYIALFIAKQLNIAPWALNFVSLDPYQTISNFQIWRLITYAFVHDLYSPFHIIFNCLLFFGIGTEIETLLGAKKFVAFCFCAIIAGGLLVLLAFFTGFSNNTVIGFSSVVLGLIILWGLYFKDRTIYFFGILPVTGIQLVIFTISIEFLYIFIDTSTSSAAHFGGIITGLFFYFFSLNTNKKRW